MNIKLYTSSRKIFLLFSFFFALLANAQAPEKMSYQAVIRNNSNALVSNANVGIKISILQGTATGTEVYTQTQTATTNVNGLVSLTIGEGGFVSGDFVAINWGNGPYFIKTETDPTGGTNYTITATTQLMSVPYALNAKTTSAVKGTNFFVPKFSSNNTLDNSNIVSVGTGGIGFTGINRTNPITQLDVNGTILTRNRMVFGPTPTGDPEYDPIWAIDNSNNNFRIFNQPNYYDPGSTHFSIAPSGDVNIANGNVNSNATGNANLLPIAFGNNQNNNGSGNVTVEREVYSRHDIRYRIHINNFRMTENNCTIFFDNNDSGIGSVLSKEFLENGDLLISGNGGLTAPVTQFMVPDEHGNGVIDSRRHLSINAITDYSFRFIIYKNNQP